MTAREIFERHYHGLTNPMTPLIVEYGFLAPGVAYELSQDEKGFLFGLTVVEELPSGATQELRRLNYAGESETAVRQRICYLQTHWERP